MKHVLIALIKAYRVVISPLYGNVCRYHPSCSAYGLRSVEVHGAIRGSWLTIRRIGRCHPWAAGGYDPVPGTPEAEAWAAEQAEQAGRPDLGDLVPRVGRPDHTGPTDRTGSDGAAGPSRVDADPTPRGAL